MIYLYLSITLLMGIIIGVFIHKKFGPKVLCIGDIVVTNYPDRKNFSLEVNNFLERIEHEKEVSFRVIVSQDESPREEN